MFCNLKKKGGAIIRGGAIFRGNTVFALAENHCVNKFEEQSNIWSFFFT